MAAIITASGAVVAGAFQLLKPKPNENNKSSVGSVSDSSVDSLSNSIEGSVSDSMLAVGTDINQTFSPTVHIHQVEPARDEGSFSSKVESRPTIVEIMDDLNKERKPYERTQVHKHYIGLPVCWPVTFYGVWPPPSYLRDPSWSVRLHSIHNERYGVNLHLDLEQYPRLKIADRGHRAWIEGQIQRADSEDVYLEDGAKLTLE